MTMLEEFLAANLKASWEFMGEQWFVYQWEYSKNTEHCYGLRKSTTISGKSTVVDLSTDSRAWAVAISLSSSTFGKLK